MAKTLQEILDPKFIPDIVSRMRKLEPPLIAAPGLLYKWPEMVVPRKTNFRLISRGDGKFYAVCVTS